MEPQPFGRGGNAEVFRARDKRNNEIVALKRIINKNEESIARMRREIEVQISICHPNVMPVFDQSTEYHWYTMPLAIEVLGRIPTPIDDNVILKMVKDCAAGLYRGHVDGYIHRDISPNNILILDDRDVERWVVSDWFFVRCLGNTTKVRTLAGLEYGTAGFAAKELWIDAHAADCRVDVYSLGRVVAWCITGEWPIPNIPLVQEGIWTEFVEISTSMEPDQRFQNMDSVIKYIDGMCRNEIL